MDLPLPRRGPHLGARRARRSSPDPHQRRIDPHRTTRAATDKRRASRVGARERFTGEPEESVVVIQRVLPRGRAYCD